MEKKIETYWKQMVEIHVQVGEVIEDQGNIKQSVSRWQMMLGD